MSRHVRWIPALVLLTSLGVAGVWSRLDGHAAQSVEESGSQVASLKEQLEKGLRARRPVEFQFVARVAQLVDSGQLSRELVQGTFSWTRTRYRNKKYLVPHFEQVLRRRAADQNIAALNNVPTTLPKIEGQ
jgi:hypothetical protein